ncbi:transglycosylase [Pigmentiphaga litoralis]|jgi:hypothetical protein|uniref:transglycosylase SLT domain-containing protein n=1 Tax=Pigmentiphaga litoralis TaxID=516702 RepID=UPI001675F9DD|nr:transglycosylase SLT domain-containing protein [Pigmentiphaga litoralis]GGX28970.1 transglycosylase [Pigmentiphaga litoralis]
MPDAQPRTSLKLMATNAHKSVADLSRSFTGFLGLALLVVMGAVWSVPDLRDNVFQWHTDAVAASVPAAPVDDVIVPLDVPHSRTVAFLESMGDGQSVHKLPAVKMSPAQVESLRRYITGKYRVSNEATRMLISTAYGVGQEMGLDPLLLLAIIAIESSFNPFAESHVGAQGLMQVLTRVHQDKFQHFGGEQAAFNPVANIRVGAMILRDCIARGGSLVTGLRMYVGVTADGVSPYGEKVLAERRRLASAAGMQQIAPLAKPAQSASNEPQRPAAGQQVVASSAMM